MRASETHRPGTSFQAIRARFLWAPGTYGHCSFDESCCLLFGTWATLNTPVATTYLSLSALRYSEGRAPFFSFLVALWVALGRFVGVVFEPIVSLVLADRRVEFVFFDDGINWYV
jgi:hypothetical protein